MSKSEFPQKHKMMMISLTDGKTNELHSLDISINFSLNPSFHIILSSEI